MTTFGARLHAAIAARVGDGDPTTAQLIGELRNAHTTASDVLDAMFAAAEDLRFANTEALTARMLSRKTVVAEAAIATVGHAVEVVGGAAFSRGHVLERLSRDVQGARFHPLPRARQTQLTGRVALGLSPV